MEEKEKTIIKILKAPIRLILLYKLRLWIYFLINPMGKTVYYWERVTTCCRKNIADFMVDIPKQNIVKNPVIEIGAGGEAFNKNIFGERYKFIATDICYFKGFIDVVCNGESLPFKSNSVGTIICTETLEHIPEYNKAIKEFYRVLLDNGSLILTVPFGYRLHQKLDYWRFTPDGLKYILKPYFKEINIKTYNYGKADNMFPLNICLTAVKK